MVWAFSAAEIMSGSGNGAPGDSGSDDCRRPGRQHRRERGHYLAATAAVTWICFDELWCNRLGRPSQADACTTNDAAGHGGY